MGFRITRYSGGAFKMHVPEGDGVERGLDVFGGYFRDGNLHLLGEICVPYREEWIHPLGTATLEGRPFPVPRNTDAFLEATYGPHWRTPDPAFKFSTPESTVRKFNGLFRGSRVGRGGWDRYYSQEIRKPLPAPSALARHVVAAEPGARSFVDLGCGRGADVRFYAEAAGGEAHVMGLDFQTRSFQAVAAELAGNERVGFWHYNLREMRTLLAVSAVAARLPAPRVLVARHLIDTIDKVARANLWRSCELMLRGQPEGRLYLEFLCRRGQDGYAARHRLKRRRVYQVRAELERAGARILSEERIWVSDAPRPARVCRMVVTWDHPTERGGEA
jgi:SAM-dependent methyltransferase